MFYSTEILSMRRKGKLARCWLAATLSDRLFKKVVTNKIISTMDITVACDEILKAIDTNRENRCLRFSLYMSSQLMYGATKLFRIQVDIFLAFLLRMRMDLNPIDMAQTKAAKTRRMIPIDYLTLPEAPDVVTAFENLQLQEDLHRLPEVDLEMIKAFKPRGYVESPADFGELTDKELDFMLCDDSDIRMLISPSREARWPEEPREDPESRYHTTGPLGLSDALPAIQESVVDEPPCQSPRTPQKRGSTAINFDTPSKKLRRSLRGEMDAAAQAENISMVSQPLRGLADSAIDAVVQAPDEFVGLPEDMEFQPIHRSAELPLVAEPNVEVSSGAPAVETTAVRDGFLHLEPLETDAPRPARSRRVRELRRIDHVTQLSDSQAGKAHCSNPRVHTLRFLVPPIPHRRRGMSAMSLLINPSTNRLCSGQTKFSTWSDGLMKNFENLIVGPFETEIDGVDRTEEFIRAGETVTNLATTDIWRESVNATGPNVTTRNRTVDYLVAVEDIAPMLPETTADDLEPPMVDRPVDITNELIPQNISESMVDENLAEIKNSTIPPKTAENQSETATVSISMIRRSNARASVPTNVRSTPDTDTGNLDEFLPPNLRQVDAEVRLSYERLPDREAIVDVSESPQYRRSQQSMHSRWTVPELLTYLEVLWSDRRFIEFTEISPPETNSRVDAAVCFTMLLKLSMTSQVVLRQKKPYGKIYITKKM